MANTLSSFLKSAFGAAPNNPFGLFNLGKSILQLIGGSKLGDTASGQAFGNVVSGVDNYFGSLFGQYLGTNLTGSEREQNEWTALREDTYFQRNTQGMIDAGLNPALMYGSGASGPSVNSSAGSSPSGLSDLLQLAMLPTQIELAESQSKLAESQSLAAQSDAAQKTANAEKTRAEIPWVDKLSQAEVDSRNAAAALDSKTIEEVEQNIKTGKAQTNKLYQEAETEEKKRELIDTQMLLNKASAQKIQALLPFEQLYLEAQTENERADAGLKLVQTAYQNKLVDSDYIGSVIRQQRANASVSEIEALLTNPYAEMPDSGAASNVVRQIITAVNNTIKVVSPFKGSKF